MKKNGDDTMIVKDIILAEVDENEGFPEKDLDEIVDNFDASEHEPPVTIGHDVKDSDPAYGWIKKVWKDGSQLWGKVSFIQDMADLIKRKVFRHRSISYYTNFKGTGKKVLRHLAILGAVPPRIKGMPALEFKEGNGEFKTIEFSELDKWDIDSKFANIADLFERLREHFIESIGVEKTDKILMNWEINQIREKLRESSGSNFTMGDYSEKKINIHAKHDEEEQMPKDEDIVTYSEAQHSTILNAALDKQKKELDEKYKEEKTSLTSQFAEKENELNKEVVNLGEKLKDKDAKIKELEEKNAKLTTDMAEVEAKSFVDGLIKCSEPKIKPAEREDAIKNIVLAANVSVEFCESIKNSYKNRPTVIELGEIPEASGEGERKKEKSLELNDKEKGIFEITPEMEKKYGSWADENMGY